jgi:hypothetical protein
VDQTKVVRELAQKRAQEAKDDIANGVLHPDKCYCMLCEYAHNLGISHLRKEQPGDTYYYSTLTINLFGLVDLLHNVTSLAKNGSTMSPHCSCTIFTDVE